MGYRCSHSGYTVEVDGVFLSKTRFVVHAALDYRKGLSEAERVRLTPKAQMELLPMQPGDVPMTLADTTRLTEAVGFAPSTPVEEGVRRLVAWYRDYYGV